ncbi:MAG: hypothetical protein KJ550_06210 [Proteobacteria bacterium]|nr:hypothetical protein [Pseudomonadota bacterium]MBU4069222.1 hypothetical protein [Pseudomonadota bacterium]MCG2759308.1 hypothetical protein [Desulfobacteraceae bacterium]MCG2831532.1 hypothetical protein [Desulfobacteraceae bacterium]
MKRPALLTGILVLFFLSLLVSSASMAQDDSGRKGTEIHSLGSITVTAEQLSEYVKNHPPEDERWVLWCGEHKSKGINGVCEIFSSF